MLLSTNQLIGVLMSLCVIAAVERPTPPARRYAASRCGRSPDCGTGGQLPSYDTDRALMLGGSYENTPIAQGYSDQSRSTHVAARETHEAHPQSLASDRSASVVLWQSWRTQLLKARSPVQFGRPHAQRVESPESMPIWYSTSWPLNFRNDPTSA